LHCFEKSVCAPAMLASRITGCLALGVYTEMFFFSILDVIFFQMSLIYITLKYK